MSKSYQIVIEEKLQQPVTGIAASGSGWAGEPPANTPDWASAEIVAQIGGAAYRIGADVAPGAFAAMTGILLNAAQHHGKVDIRFYQPTPAATPILLAVRMQSPQH